ncbi:MCE family protein [Actinocorallia longicatena]|uniref:MCE family protein n=1 Tax=Actinocorallia longicatena TaxID=111803 RepID=A0ABP6QQV1_9ACTN
MMRIRRLKPGLRRPRLKPMRDRNPIIVAIVGLVFMALFAAGALSADSLPVIGGGTNYSAYFSESAGLRKGNEVRVAGVKVGKVTAVTLDHAKVKITFRVKDAWVGNQSTATIDIKTLLGDKFLTLDPLGDAVQDPKETIPQARTIAPYDVAQAFQDISSKIDQLDTGKLAQSFDVLAAAFKDTPGSVRKALTGLTAISDVIAERDAKLKELFAATRTTSSLVADRTGDFEVLLKDGNLLLGELRRRRAAIHALLIGSQKMAKEISGLVDDNADRLKPTLTSLGKVVDVLLNNQDQLDRALKLTGPYSRLLGNAVGNGRWMDGYLCGLFTREYVSTVPEQGCKPPAEVGKK